MSRLPAVKRRRLSPPELDDAAATKTFAQNAAQWNLEDDYAQRVRKRDKGKKADRLPIKTQDGNVERMKFKEPEPAPQAEGEDSGEDSMLEEGDEQQVEPEQEPEKPVKEQVIEAQEDLARIAGMLSEDPEEHISQLKNISKIAASRVPTVQKLAMAAQVAIYKDLIPGYRIRPASEDEFKAKLSRDVKRLRNFEQTLVSCYREFVVGLGKTIKYHSKNSSPASKSVVSTAFSCVCNLLDAVPHFNFRSELLNIMVAKLASRQADADHAKCRGSLETLFENDEEGQSSLEAVTLLTKMMKAKDYNIHETVLNTFLQLRLLSEYSFRASTNRIDKDEEEKPVFNGKIKKKEREFRTKKQKKMMRERKEVEKEMKEADATVSFEERDKNQSEMLKLVFVAYFRILKMRKQNLMGAVLEGLARYAHLINQDFFGDILESLRDLIASQDVVLDDKDYDEDDDDNDLDSERDRSREILLCVVTAFSLLQGQDVHKAASSLHLDLSFFTTRLYNTVFPLSMDPNIESAKRIATTNDSGVKRKINVQTPALLLLRSLNALMLPPQSIRSVPPTLLAAFTKRLLTASIHLPEKSAQATLSLVKQVVKAHGNKVTGLWYSDERRGDGVFDVERVEVESANPFATSVFEGEILRMHYSPKIREGLKEITDGVKSRRD